MQMLVLDASRCNCVFWISRVVRLIRGGFGVPGWSLRVSGEGVRFRIEDC